MTCNTTTITDPLDAIYRKTVATLEQESLVSLKQELVADLKQELVAGLRQESVAGLAGICSSFERRSILSPIHVQKRLPDSEGSLNATR